MPGSNRLSIEVHFVPLSNTERDERMRRLGALLLRGALRAVQQKIDHDERTRLAAEDTLSVDVAPK